MRIVTAAQMKLIDETTINNMGIPGIVLMENAAIAVVNELSNDMGGITGRNVMIFAGKGNNGGDAFAVARHLRRHGANVLVILLSKYQDISGDARVNLDIAKNMGITVVEVIDKYHFEKIKESLYITDVVIDGIFGIGLKGDIEGIQRDVIEIINNSGRYVLSIDVPSGLDATTGKVMGVCIKANKTVTFGFAKVGMVIAPGSFYCGNIAVRDIGLSDRFADFDESNMYLLEKSMTADAFGVRNPDTHKGDYGKLLVIAGSTGMAGSAALCCRAAVRAGVGLVYAAVPQGMDSILAQKLTEQIIIPVEYNKNTDALMQLIAGANAVVMGPGLSQDANVAQTVMKIIAQCSVPMVLDADALNILSKDINVLSSAKVPIIATPHPGEMARLLHTDTDTVQSNRIMHTTEFATKRNIITALKGYRTVVSDVDGTVYINPTGNAGMATAGSGDVLSGIIGALLGRGIKPINAVNAAVYVHGLAGDLAAGEKGEHGLIASDIIDRIPDAAKKLFES